EVVGDFGKQAFGLYEKILEEEVPGQDARYVIPESALTRVIFAISPRYLLKLHNILKNSPVKSLIILLTGAPPLDIIASYTVIINQKKYQLSIIRQLITLNLIN
ncbi:MAG: hypothetical protein U9O65_01405, partial [Thermotogota bacterium]|nr:hypothetical protein [Thermotogota bacterium]